MYLSSMRYKADPCSVRTYSQSYNEYEHSERSDSENSDSDDSDNESSDSEQSIL